MKRFNRTNKSSPLCKFGPGGDFVDEWDAPSASPQHNESHLGQVLNVIAEIIGATVQPEILTEIACALPVKSDSKTPVLNKLSIQEKTADGLQLVNHSQAARNTSTGGKLSKEPMLFSDDWGTGSSVKHKPNHRLRTHRRTARKKTAGAFNGQSTLFEINPIGRKTA